ncbi:Ser/Thr phosphatase family protein [Desulfitobacterium hafniense DP7]|uniref:Ser/Thr phosphatase family protein n=1 Tax=Desulfitobacterium hafniense DP7 TaxID=537010 RepID=G9XGU5_DESHA|nr:metallophosphoesterase [Desulfitobacterium hafniense]EHL09130.1 Ser/Thr phosphatase family protein [Desulfitobacterium hafniense DP7]
MRTAQKGISRRTFIIGGIGLLSYLYFNVHSLAVKHYTVAINGLPQEFEGFTILHLTDLHAKKYGDRQDKLIRLINRQNFDMVAMTGDFIDKDNPDLEPTLELIQGLAAKPIFFVPGNHEWRYDFSIKSSLEEHGVKILDNKNAELARGDARLWIAGVDDPYLHRDKLEEALHGIADAQPKLLLAHAPNIFKPAAESGVELVLVGHTHGGQVRLPLIGAIVAPGQGLFPQYDYGHFTAGSTNMIVNGGLGESTLPLRFCSRPEIVLVKLVSAPQ